MSQDLPRIGALRGLEESPGLAPARVKPSSEAFATALKEAVAHVDGLQRESETAQTAYVRGDNVELHDVLIKVEEADVAFRAMMEVRNKLVDAYREVMRMGSGG